MKKTTLYTILYVITYFIIDFLTGFRASWDYYFSINGWIGIPLYIISGMIFAHLIFVKRTKIFRVWIFMMIYGFAVEIFLYKNPMLQSEPISFVILAALWYTLILLIPKFLVGRIK